MPIHYNYIGHYISFCHVINPLKFCQGWNQRLKNNELFLCKHTANGYTCKLKQSPVLLPKKKKKKKKWRSSNTRAGSTPVIQHRSILYLNQFFRSKNSHVVRIHPNTLWKKGQKSLTCTGLTVKLNQGIETKK